MHPNVLAISLMKAPLDSNFDTKLESSFSFILANSALDAPCKAAYPTRFYKTPRPASIVQTWRFLFYDKVQ